MSIKRKKKLNVLIVFSIIHLAKVDYTVHAKYKQAILLLPCCYKYDNLIEVQLSYAPNELKIQLLYAYLKLYSSYIHVISQQNLKGPWTCLF